MIKQTIEFEDFEGNKVSRDFYFNLNKAEISELQFRKDGTELSEILNSIASENTTVREVLDLFKELIVAGVGRKSEDGIRFIKNDDIRSELVDSNAYSELLFSIIDDPKKATTLIRGMLPRDMAREVDKSVGNVDELSVEELKERLNKLQGEKK